MTQVGHKAPDFKLPDQDGIERSLSDFHGKSILLAFYSFDFSPICTDEFKCFQEDLSELNDLNIQVIGISVDSKHSHREFASKHHLNFPLLSDFNRSVSKLYGTLREEGFSNRAYFLLDKNGVIKFKKIMDSPGKRMENPDIIKEIKRH